MEEINFNENNSGGSWWLSQEQYHKLIEAGWKPEITSYDNSIRGCSKSFNSIKEAILEWEEITGETASEEGCNCCGAPFSFSSKNDYCSGEDCLDYLYSSNTDLSKRELLEKIETSYNKDYTNKEKKDEN